MSEIRKIIEVKDLDLYYGEFQALKKINTSIRENTITALIGPSGCGKSTFLRSINRMNDLIEGVKTEGTISYNGRDIIRDFDILVLRKKIGMVFQKPNPFDMSIYDNVAYGPRIHGTRKKVELDRIVEDSLRKAALWDEVKGRLGESGLSLSGGQQQRLCIARSLSVNPDIILMDEPTSALDPLSTEKIELLLNSLKEFVTIIIVTHNMQQAARISDRTIFFLNGEIVEENTTSDLFTKPRDKRSEDYITGRFG